jgi:hypothetical protein
VSEGQEPDSHPAQAQRLALPLPRRQLGGQYQARHDDDGQARPARRARDQHQTEPGRRGRRRGPAAQQQRPQDQRGAAPVPS